MILRGFSSAVCTISAMTVSVPKPVPLNSHDLATRESPKMATQLFGCASSMASAIDSNSSLLIDISGIVESRIVTSFGVL